MTNTQVARTVPWYYLQTRIRPSGMPSGLPLEHVPHAFMPRHNQSELCSRVGCWQPIDFWAHVPYPPTYNAAHSLIPPTRTS